MGGVLDFSVGVSSGKWSRNGLRVGLAGYVLLVYSAFFGPEPLVMVSGPTVAENRSKIDQDQHLDFSFPVRVLLRWFTRDVAELVGRCAVRALRAGSGRRVYPGVRRGAPGLRRMLLSWSLVRFFAWV